MKIGAPTEKTAGEARVALTPDSAKQLKKLGHECLIQKGAGKLAGFSDKAYEEAGVIVVSTAKALWESSDVVIKVQKPEKTELAYLDKSKPLSVFSGRDRMERRWKLPEKQVQALSQWIWCRVFHVHKRWTRCPQWQISLAIVRSSRQAIILAAFLPDRLPQPAKVPPAKVLVIGAGVAGLAAIGTAQSLGAIVRAFDVRPEVAEQIESMGAEFLMLEFSEDGSGDGGYAKPASPEFIEKEMQLFPRTSPRGGYCYYYRPYSRAPCPKIMASRNGYADEAWLCGGGFGSRAGRQL